MMFGLDLVLFCLEYYLRVSISKPIGSVSSQSIPRLGEHYIPSVIRFGRH